MNDNPPPLPSDIGHGGANIWAWGAALSAWSQRQQKKRELRDKLGQHRCGECRLWMTRDCLRETNVNGQKYGPSMKGLICGRFTIEPSWARFREDAACELGALLAEESVADKPTAGEVKP